jgi:methylation protein EvaC
MAESTRRNIGAHTQLLNCRFCSSPNLSKILDFDTMPLAGGFLKKEDIPNEELYPLSLAFCRDCALIFVREVIPPETLFKNYFYFSSAIKTLVTHCESFAVEVIERFLKGREKPSVFEIGCNDGVMLKPFAARGVKAVGVDPASNVVASVEQKNFTIIDAFFDEQVGDKVLAEHGQFDAITSSYSFAHIDNMQSVLKGVAKLLKKNGAFMFEVYYLGTMLDEMQYDMIYHEHMSYYSLVAIEKFLAREGMEVFDVKFTPGVRSGAVRFYAQHKEAGRPASAAVYDMRVDEKERGFHKEETFADYGAKVAKTRTQMMGTLNRLKAEGKRIIGYGASGRGTMIMNYCGINTEHLDYIVDDAPAKHGFLTPGTHVEIHPWEKTAQGEQPEYAVLFAWSFMKEVMAKRSEFLSRGGKFIVPLPEVKVVGKDGEERI